MRNIVYFSNQRFELFSSHRLHKLYTSSRQLFSFFRRIGVNVRPIETNCREFESGYLEREKEGQEEKKGGRNRRRTRLGSCFRDIGGRRRGAREVKPGQAEAFDSPTESTGLRTVPTDKPPPPPPPLCAHGSRGFDADTRRKRLRRVNRNAGHEATDARENGHRSFSSIDSSFSPVQQGIPHLPSFDD